MYLSLVVLAMLLATLPGCRGREFERRPIHLNPNMDDQPRYLAQEASEFFADGKTMRHPPEHTVPRGAWLGDPAVVTGLTEAGEPIDAIPIDVSEELVVRGERQYGIYCGPCHGERLDGRGMLNRRAQVDTEDLLAAHTRQMPDGQLYDTISRGFGLMAGYAYLMPPEDRWAVVAYIRQRQREEPVSEPAAPAAQVEESQGEEETSDGSAGPTERPAQTPAASAGADRSEPPEAATRPRRSAARWYPAGRPAIPATPSSPAAVEAAGLRAGRPFESDDGADAAGGADPRVRSLRSRSRASRLEPVDGRPSTGHGSVTGPAAAVHRSATADPSEAHR